MTGARCLADLGIHLRYPNRPGEHRAPCPSCDRGSRDDALAVRLEPDRGAAWLCHRCGERGCIRPERAERPARPAPARQERRPKPKRYDTLAPWARALWASCDAVEPGTIAAPYLERRGCALPPAGSDLRWHPSMKHPSGHIGPTLVALVTDVETGEAISLHRTWIKPDGSGKAELDKPRILLAGHRSNGVIRLWPDAHVTTGLAIAEGIETALAAAREGITPIWTTISASNMAAFPVLPGLEGLTVVADHDRPDRRGRRAGVDAAAAVIERYTRAGFDPERDLLVILPPVEGQDAADMVAV